MLRNDSETRNGTQAPFSRGTSDPHQVTLRMLTGKTPFSLCATFSSREPSTAYTSGKTCGSSGSSRSNVEGASAFSRAV